MKKPHQSLMVCGILSSLIYICTDIFTGLITPGYSFNSQTVSELSAIGAPTRLIWQIITFVYNPLLIAFGWGIKKLGDNNKKRTLAYLGSLIIVWGILGFIWLLFPMNLRGNIGTTADTMHLLMTAITVLLMTAMIIIGSGIQNNLFRLYSILTLLFMMVFGVLTGQQASRVATDLPTPWMGITERVTSYSPLIWIIILALSFILTTKKKP